MDTGKNTPTALNPTERSKGYMIGLIIMLFLGMGLLMLDRNLPLYIGYFIMEDMGMTNTQLGLMATALGIGWGISAVVFGAFSDKFGRKVVVIPAVIIMSLLSAGTGLASTIVLLLIARVVMGISEAPAAALMPGIIQVESKPEKRGRNVGIVMSSGALMGSFISPVVGVGLTEAYGWRTCFYVIAVPGIILAILMIKFLKEPRSEAEPKDDRNGGKKEKLNFRMVLHNRNVWLAATACAIYVAGQNIFNTFGPLYLINIQGHSPSTMSWIVGGAGFGNFIWMILTPMISDRIGRRNTLMLFGVLSLIVPLCMVYVTSSTVLIPICFLLAVNAGMAPLVMAIIPAESAGPKLMGIAMGICLMFGDLIGGAIGPLIGGVVADQTGGYLAPMVMYMGLMVVVAIFGFFMKETAPRKLEKQAAVSLNSSNEN